MSQPLSSGSSPEPRGRANLLLAGGSVFAAVFLFFSLTARFETFYKDDWDFVVPLYMHFGFAEYVFPTSNEHLAVIPKVLLWSAHRLTGRPDLAMWGLGLGLYLMTALTLLAYQRQRADLPPLVWRGLAGATLAILFFTYQLQVFLSPSGITILLAIGMSVGAILAAIRAHRHSGAGYALRLIAAAGLAFAAVFSSGQGIGAPFALLAIVLTMRGRHTAWMSAAGLAISIGMIWFYSRAIGAPMGALDVYAIARAVPFGLALFAGPLSFVSVGASVAVGAIVLAAGVVDGFLVMRRGPRATDCQLLCLGVMVFVLVASGLTAIARSHLGVAQASQSRYALLAMLYLSSALTLWTIRLSTVGRTRRLWAAFATIGVLLVALLPIDLFVGAVWWAKTENAGAAALALQARVPDFEWIRTLYPNPAIPYERSLAIPALNWPDVTATSDERPPVCSGTLRLERIEPGHFYRISGQVAAPASATIVLRDRAGAAQGLARRQPLVKVPDPSYGQVIAAVSQAIRDRGRDAEWFGFAQAGSGAPYEAFATQGRKTQCSVMVAAPD